MSVQLAQVLIVDDNEMNRDMLARRLERQGCQAISVEDGVQALEILTQHPFDLVLLDIMMPRMTGYEVLDRMKSDPTTRHIPVIMISAVDDLESVVKCVEKGAEDYLFKPFNPILLKARVNASLEKKRLRDQEQILLRQANSSGATEANKTLVQRFIQGLASGADTRDLVSANYALVTGDQATLDLQKLGLVFSGGGAVVQNMIAEGDQVVAQVTLQTNGDSMVLISQISHGRIEKQSCFASRQGLL